jgi:hypothetical protein
MWFVDEEHIDAVRKASFKVYGASAPCLSCWEGTPCPEMEKIAAEASKDNLGRLLQPSPRRPPPPPGEPKKDPKVEPPPPPPPQKEHVVARAAKLLGIEWWTSPDEIRAAARRKAKEVHPDKPGGSHEQMIAVLAARDLLLGGR